MDTIARVIPMTRKPAPATPALAEAAEIRDLLHDLDPASARMVWHWLRLGILMHQEGLSLPSLAV